MKRKWDISSDELRKKCVQEVITRVDEQKDYQFGVVAADEVIDIVLQNLAPDIYNSAIADANKLLKKKLDDLEVEIDLLLQQG